MDQYEIKDIALPEEENKDSSSEMDSIPDLSDCSESALEDITLSDEENKDSSSEMDSIPDLSNSIESALEDEEEIPNLEDEVTDHENDNPANVSKTFLTF